LAECFKGCLFDFALRSQEHSDSDAVQLFGGFFDPDEVVEAVVGQEVDGLL
jgi:hypothetical protein